MLYIVLLRFHGNKKEYGFRFLPDSWKYMERWIPLNKLDALDEKSVEQG